MISKANNGADETRTHDFYTASVALSQLSYGPVKQRILSNHTRLDKPLIKKSYKPLPIPIPPIISDTTKSAHKNIFEFEGHIYR
jgi:hypothetical protein